MFNNPSLSKSPPPLRSANSPRSPALPHFEDPPLEDQPEEQQPQPEEAPVDDEIPYPEPSSEQTLLPPPNFIPFFALVEDSSSGEHYHPYVHYVFADDDPIIVTAASMRGMGLDDTRYLPHETPEGHEDQDHVGEEEEAHYSPVESPLPPPIPGVREHYLIVDVGADGRTVVDAQSLSSSWQITDASTRTAPSFDESSPDQGLMLRIEGVEIPGKKKGKGKGQPGDNILSEARERNQGDIFAALDGLVEGIEGSLAVASKVTEFGSREKDENAQADLRAETEEKGTVETNLPLDFDRTG
ncbi:hypothetical protein BU25DRAFT_78705 [Macroventuria anomochaeta]|uniref:Uncharacterized protein n=1 Tax=Macroventuria anomochaeta TaxID=301207 RepID=A0ACB6SF51_9PLEO|nr:uncharacterized protein BU25DRAFT_78705 [Macroventuria anomochaeta]KAF2632613.1 hypothetical protein BU25DRAFT_78705 [Macroventuria anomochaeta]